MNPRSFFFLLIFLLLFLCRGNAEGQSKAQAELRNARGQKAGRVEFEEEAQGVRIRVAVDGLKPGVHALHIHEKPFCAAPDFSSAGGHFNPFGKKHGFLNTAGHHAGDLPNIIVGADGKCRTEFFSDQFTLSGNTGDSLFREPGTSVVIHEMPDDYFSDPAGKGGRRIACGRIEEAQ